MSRLSLRLSPRLSPRRRLRASLCSSRRRFAQPRVNLRPATSGRVCACAVRPGPGPSTRSRLPTPWPPGVSPCLRPPGPARRRGSAGGVLASALCAPAAGPVPGHGASGVCECVCESRTPSHPGGMVRAPGLPVSPRAPRCPRCAWPAAHSPHLCHWEGLRLRHVVCGR